LEGLAVREVGGSMKAPSAARRQFRVEGKVWTVYELPRVALVFEAELDERRVCGYPQNWRTLGDEELYILSWGAG
jgi:hypothetical protein